jgi:MYXO-CTERM domain-containing protein
MKKLSFGIIAGMAFLCTSPAFAQDGGVETCGAITTFGECQTDDAVWCSEDNVDAGNSDADLIRLQCAEFTEPGTCAELNDFGSWCVFQPGETCAFVSPNDDLITFGCDDGAGNQGNAGCDIFAGCVNNVNSCTPVTAPARFLPTCYGDGLAVDCQAWGQPVTVDCTDAAIGGTGCSAGACQGIAAGGDCDDSIYLCADGLVCEGAGPTSLGTCVAGPTPVDAGPAPADGGTTPADDGGIEPPELCGAVTSVEGECQGTDAVWCSEEGNANADLVRFECGDILGDGTLSGTCVQITDFGSWCEFQDGESCVFSTGTGLLQFSCGDTGSPNWGCSFESGCTAVSAPCAQPAGGGQFTPTCDNNFLAMSCGVDNQPLGFDCAAGSGTCSAGQCVGLAAGESCDDEFLVCQYQCSGATHTSYGTCTDANGMIPATDGGVPPADAGPAPTDGGVTPTPDAGPAPADAGPAPVDAGPTPTPDAGPTPTPDAGVTPAPDAGSANGGGNGSGNGGGIIPADAGADEEEEAPPTSGGCGCDSTSAPDAALALFGMFGLVLVRRRRR